MWVMMVTLTEWNLESTGRRNNVISFIVDSIIITDEVLVNSEFNFPKNNDSLRMRTEKMVFLLMRIIIIRKIRLTVWHL
jgi:hypothetical protein